MPLSCLPFFPPGPREILELGQPLQDVPICDVLARPFEVVEKNKSGAQNDSSTPQSQAQGLFSIFPYVSTYLAPMDGEPEARSLASLTRQRSRPRSAWPPKLMPCLETATLPPRSSESGASSGALLRSSLCSWPGVGGSSAPHVPALSVSDSAAGSLCEQTASPPAGP